MPTATPTATRAPVSRRDVDRKIAELRRQRIPARLTQEDLDRPLDRRIRVDEAGKGRHRVVLVVGKQDVSWATVVTFAQQIGSSVLRMGGIAGVGTHDDHRFKGYSRCVMENCLRWMRAEGFHTTMLYGIPSYYPKFGYAKAFPRVRFTLAVRDAEAAPMWDCTVAPFAADAHLKAVLAMYHANNAGRTGVTRRDPAAWQPFRKGISWGSDAIPEVILGKSGKPMGYIVFNGDFPSAAVLETGFASPAVFPALLATAARHAWQQRLETIEFFLPEDDALMAYACRFGLRKEVTSSADGGAMVRLITIPAALDAVRGELAQRVAGSGALNLRTNLDCAGIAWSAGTVEVGPVLADVPVVRLPQWLLAQFLYGHASVPAESASGHLKGTASALDSFAMLFPPRPHYQYVVDHF